MSRSVYAKTSSTKRQLDIFGELLDSLYLSNKYAAAISHEGWRHVRGIVEYVMAKIFC